MVFHLILCDANEVVGGITFRLRASVKRTPTKNLRKKRLFDAQKDKLKNYTSVLILANFPFMVIGVLVDLWSWN